MRLLHFTHAGKPDYVVFVEDDDDTPTEDYARPGYVFQRMTDLDYDFDLLVDAGTPYVLSA